MKKKNTKIKADDMGGIETSYSADPNIKRPRVSPGANTPPMPEEAAAVETSPAVDLREAAPNSDANLAEPLKYIVSPSDALEKVETLLQKVKEGRPDLGPQVDQLLSQVETIENGGQPAAAEAGVPAGTPEAAETAPQEVAPGASVEVQTEEQVFRGVVVDRLENGNFDVQTDQNMMLNDVPAEAIRVVEAETFMTLPASLQLKSLRIKALQGVDLDEFLKSKSPQELDSLIAQWKARLEEVGDALEDPDFVHQAISRAEQIRSESEQDLHPTVVSSQETLMKVKASKKFLAATKVKAGFMEMQVEKNVGIAVDTAAGTYYLPGEVAEGLAPGNVWTKDYKAEIAAFFEKFKDFLPVSSADNIYEVENVEGFFGRYSAPGYLDATDWYFNENIDALKKELQDMYGDDDEPEEVLKASIKANADINSVITWPAGSDELESAKTWNNSAIDFIGGGFHPDDPADDYINLTTDEPTFTPEQATAFDANRERAFNAFEAAGEDIYEYGLKHPTFANNMDPVLKASWVKKIGSSQNLGAGKAGTATPEVRANLKARIKQLKASKKGNPMKKPVSVRTIEASAFDKIPELDLGDGFKVRRKGGKKEEPGKVEKTPEANAAEVPPTPATEVPKEPKAKLPFGADLKAAEPLGVGMEKPKAEDKSEAPKDDKSDKPKAEDKPKSDEKKDDKFDGPMLEVVDADGKVVETYPDAFGDDTVAIIKFFQAILPSLKKDKKKDEPKKDDKKEEPKKDDKKDEKKDDEKLAEKPKGLPAVKVDKKDEEGLKSAQRIMEQRVVMARSVVTELAAKQYIVADQRDIDEELLKQEKGKESLESAMNAAFDKAANRKFREILAMPDAELLTLRASLPSMKVRAAQLEITASQEGLEPLELLTVQAEMAARAGEVSIGAAFGFAGFRR